MVKPVGVLLADGRVVGDWGITPLADAPKGASIFARSHDDAFALVREGRGRAKYWRKRYVAYEIDGFKIKSAKDIFANCDPLEALDALVTFRDWAWDNNANVSSFTGTANSIWRGTLNPGARMMVASGKLPAPTKELFLGGRQEVNRGVYDRGSLWDISGAYPSAMGEIVVGSRYRRMSGFDSQSLADVSLAGFARARVAVRKTFFGPVPARVGSRTTFPINGIVDGVFDFAELRTAKMIGLNVEIYEAWIARGLRFPWKKWSNVIAEGRELPGLASRIVKAASNSLWGSFAINGTGRWVSYVEGRMVLEATPEPFKRANSEVLSAHIASYVRSRLFMEALYFNREAVLACHTDGCIFAPGGHPVPVEDSFPTNGIGKWQERKELNDLVLVGPATYRYKEDNELRYSMPGIPSTKRAMVFSHLLKGEVEERASKLVERIPFS